MVPRRGVHAPMLLLLYITHSSSFSCPTRLCTQKTRVPLYTGAMAWRAHDQFCCGSPSSAVDGVAGVVKSLKVLTRHTMGGAACAAAGVVGGAAGAAGAAFASFAPLVAPLGSRRRGAASTCSALACTAFNDAVDGVAGVSAGVVGVAANAAAEAAGCIRTYKRSLPPLDVVSEEVSAAAPLLGVTALTALTLQLPAMLVVGFGAAWAQKGFLNRLSTELEDEVYTAFFDRPPKYKQRGLSKTEVLSIFARRPTASITVFASSSLRFDASATALCNDLAAQYRVSATVIRGIWARKVSFLTTLPHWTEEERRQDSWIRDFSRARDKMAKNIPTHEVQVFLSPASRRYLEIAFEAEEEAADNAEKGEAGGGEEAGAEEGKEEDTGQGEVGGKEGGGEEDAEEESSEMLLDSVEHEEQEADIHKETEYWKKASEKALLESVYQEQEGSLDNMLWGGKENEQTINFLETCLKRDVAPPPPPESDGPRRA